MPLAMQNTANPCAIGRRNGVPLANSWSMWIGLKSPLNPAKLTTSDSVTVRPPEVHSLPTSRSSKYRCEEEKLIGGLRMQRGAFRSRYSRAEARSKGASGIVGLPPYATKAGPPGGKTEGRFLLLAP